MGSWVNGYAREMMYGSAKQVFRPASVIARFRYGMPTPAGRPGSTAFALELREEERPL